MLKKNIKNICKLFISPFVTYSISDNKIYLTFDDGPDPQVTPAILKALEKHEVTATFFVEGRKVEKHPELARLIVDSGHSVGYHTYTHQSLRKISFAELLSERLKMTTLFKTHFGGETFLFRPPYGELNLLGLIVFMQKKIIHWSMDSEDSLGIGKEKLLANMSPENIREGDIILMHDDSSLTAETLPAILTSLKKHGFSFGKL